MDATGSAGAGEMIPGARRGPYRLLRVALISAFLLAWMPMAAAQSASPQTSPQTAAYERTYRRSKSTVEKALKELQPSMGGRLPVVEGFALAGDHPLNRYQRAYYQSSVQVNSTVSGGSVVRVATKVTAWYADSIPSRSGYQLLISNGRLESDLLDELGELLADSPNATSLGGNYSGGSSENVPVLVPPAPAPGELPPVTKKETAQPALSAPISRLPETGRTFSSSPVGGLSAQQLADTQHLQKPLNQAQSALQAEAASLEEVLKNQAHPKNLVAIKKSGTPVVDSPRFKGKTLFLASAHDEFEMLDFSADWVHVRISGLSRGWIWRTSLEMPEGISDIPLAGERDTLVAADLFQVTREEIAPFPGDWESLRGKSVKIISVQKIQENEKDSGPPAKLEFAKSLLDKAYTEFASKSQEVSGIVLIFDSIDGGMIAATIPTVQAWKAGTLNDAALWHECYFDPPETFRIPGALGSR